MAKRVIFALLLLYIEQALSFQCYACLSYVSFADCDSKATKVDCDTLKPDLPWIPELNGTFACGMGSGSSPNGKSFIKTCVPKMSETEFCALLTSETVGGTVDVCKVCTENLCNKGPEQEGLTAALLLLTVGLLLRVQSVPVV
ncbi:uncharacterized protein LOC125760723 [Anopheles funestus]|uniref:uncharacterized protein LOC125760723 n=1 Tax=Anopheles funestus TaxID=62324 RepID=UPI0020C5BCB1|nr:uncharacterized protein LOC125760723 [Anopheles funestus]